jgi:hypothetical protein
MIGGIAETQEMLDHCAAHGVVSDVEIISIAGDQSGLRAGPGATSATAS